MEKNEVTMKDIAKHLNVSITTVSKAFKNHPDLNKKTRDLILKTASDMGYVKNYSASILRKKRTDIIGVLMASATNPFYNALFNGIESTAMENGYHIIYANSKRDKRIQEDSIRMFLERRVDGIIIAPVDPERDEGDRFSFRDAKGVLAFHRDGGQYDMVYTDEIKGGFKATRHLIENGCRRIMMLNNYILHPGSQDRIRGYRKALDTAGLDKQEELIVHCSKLDPDHRLNEGYSVVKETLEKEISFDGIFCFNDIIAYGAVKALKEMGLTIPGDVAVVGYDDLDYSPIISPPLSSVSYSQFEMGSRITKLLLKRLQESSMKPARIVLETKLEIRESSCRC